MDNLRELLIEEIDKDIARRQKFETRDFMVTEYLGWGSILLGTASGISGAFSAPGGLIAVFGALAGLLVAVDKAFNFSKRSIWNGEYKLSLKEVRYKLELSSNDPAVIATDYNKVRKEWESKFPGHKGP